MHRFLFSLIQMIQGYGMLVKKVKAHHGIIGHLGFGRQMMVDLHGIMAIILTPLQVIC